MVCLRNVFVCVLALTVVTSAAAAAAKGRRPVDHLLNAVRQHVGAEATTLKDAAELTGRYFGSCLAQSELTNTKLINALLADWNCATPENEMKWDATEPQNNTWTFTAGDAIYNWTQTHNFLLRGHTLVWHSQLPNWVSSLTNVDALTEAMYNHMEVLMAHYKGKIYAWDVVNEAFADDGTENLRQSVWTRVFGNSTKFIELAFTHARKQDANAKLCYNDYSTDGINPKSNGVYNMVKDFKTRGVPIDCVGFQGHLNGYPTATFQQNLQRFADLGVEVYMTELDIQETTSGGAQQQADAYSAVVGACLNVTACKGITTWGVDDANSWKSNISPLLLDSSFAKKPAYYSVLDVLNSAAPTEDDEEEEDTCVAQVHDLGSRLGRQLKFKITSLNGFAVKSVSVHGRSGEHALQAHGRGVFELKGAHVPRTLPVKLTVTTASGAKSTITIGTLKTGVTSSC